MSYNSKFHIFGRSNTCALNTVTTLASLLLAIQVWILLALLLLLFNFFHWRIWTWILQYNNLITFPPAEAHPDVIQSTGEATLESYKNDLAYLKKKVTTSPCKFYSHLLEHALTSLIKTLQNFVIERYHYNAQNFIFLMPLKTCGLALSDISY